MKTILSILKKIVILIIILFIPISVLVATTYLSFNSIPLWNIGIRNILKTVLNLIIPIIFIDYIISTTLVVSFTDKMLLKPLLQVHIGALVPAILVFSIYYFFTEGNYPLKTKDEKIYTGYLTYVKPERFNELGSKILFLTKKRERVFDAYILNRENGELKIFREIKPSSREKPGSFYLDRKRKIIIFHSKSGRKALREEIQLTYGSDVKVKSLAPVNKLIIKLFIPAYRRISSKISVLAIKSKIILIAALLLAMIIFIIPVCYLMNDALWGLSGITGTVLVLTLLPVLLLIAEKVTIRLKVDLLGGYNFLLLAIITCIPGILIDAGILISRLKK